MIGNTFAPVAPSIIPEPVDIISKSGIPCRQVAHRVVLLRATIRRLPRARQTQAVSQIGAFMSSRPNENPSTAAESARRADDGFFAPDYPGGRGGRR
jgi:hypothetical protein